MTITPATPMRQVGDAPASAWASELAGSPMAASADAIRAAASPHGALCLVQAKRESSYGRAANAQATNNAWGLMVAGSNPSRLQAFATWADGAKEFARRLSDPAPPYDPQDISLKEYVRVYVGGPGCRPDVGWVCANGESHTTTDAYAAAVVADLNRLLAAGPTGPTTPTGPSGPTGPTADPWRPYPYPAMVPLIVRKPQDGAGFDRCPFRRPLIRGFCTHITDGGGQIEGIKALFEGPRAYDALADLVIGRDGRIGLLNDWRDPANGGTRAGWANGGTDGLEGEGIAYFRKFPDINVNLVSCEHIAAAGQAWTDAQIASSIEVRTALAQELRIPAATYPVKPEWGVSSEQQHRNFATKPDPGEPYISTLDPIVRREVKAKLAAWQGDVTTPPPPPPADPTRYTRFGFTLEQISGYFGTMRRFNRDGTTDDLPFDPKGPLSLLWMARCNQEGKFPEAEELHIYDSTIAPGEEQFATWEGGWVCYLPLNNQMAGWRWLDDGPA